MPNYKRIVSIEIENFRAYFGKYPPIALSEGENLLIYGENGSGKSSLFKALNNYFSNSIAPLTFMRNRYLANQDGKICVEFDDFNAGARLNNPVTLQFGTGLNNNTQQFIQNAALVKGFLDYTSLLDIYFHKESKPNLFNLIVLILLGEHIPGSTGGSYKFKDKWEQLQANLITKAYTRNDRCHRDALAELPNFEIHLRGTLLRVFAELNRLLGTYFKDLSLEIDFELKPMQFHYGVSKMEWYIPAEIHLQIKRDGVAIADSYNDYLNEARLSAFAICIYLASLKTNPTNIELKLLYLDDIFIGLDAANRMPILNILNTEFSDYQIFLSTYDRHTYEVAKRNFVTSKQKWSNIELYVGGVNFNNITFDKPIIVNDDDNFKRAMFFLHHPDKPDYPAAANYLRKHAEDILTQCLPTHEIREDDLSQIPGYQLTKLVNAGIKFLAKISFNDSLLAKLKNALPTLLHPLSHFNVSSPIYKKELLEVQNLLIEIKDYLVHTVSICSPILHANHLLVLNIPISLALTNRYKFRPREMVYVISEPGQAKRVSHGHCYCCHMCEVGHDGSEKNGKDFSATIDKFQYKSIGDAYEQMFNFNVVQHQHLVKSLNFTNDFSVHTDGTVQQLSALLQ